MRASVWLVLALTLAGCAASSASTARPRESPGSFIERILREELRGKFAAQYEELHPGHQRLITRSQYVRCSRAIGGATAHGREFMTVESIRDDPIDVRGVAQRTSKLVTVTVRQYSSAAAPRQTYSLHAVQVGSAWRWILAPLFLDAIAKGKCLDGSPLRR